MAEQKKPRPKWWPNWYDGTKIDEEMFCRDFLRTNKMICSGGAFFTVDGLMVDDKALRNNILTRIRGLVMTGLTRKIDSIIELLKLMTYVIDFPPEEDRIHFRNGTLFLDGHFVAGKKAIVRSRLQIDYDPNAEKPVLWLSFVDALLEPDDVLTLQEYLGYCLLPTNKAQRMMLIKGGGGEGKSQVGTVIKTLLGAWRRMAVSARPPKIALQGLIWKTCC